METTIENVTPKKAEAWLNKNPCNRNLREGVAEKYAADMARGTWTDCTAPIAFYDDGELADGQHRLYAIIESGTTQRFIIARDLPRAAGLNIDTGASRSVVDNARISGSDPGLTNTILTAARAIHEGVRGTTARSNAQRLEVVARYREAAEFCNSYAPRTVKFIGSAPIMGAIGRAFMHERDKERLKRFCTVMRSGMMADDTESAAVALRLYLTGKGAIAGSALWVDTFWKAQNAIHAFMRGRPMHVIKKVSAEAYPLVNPEAKPQKGHPARQQRARMTEEDRGVAA